MPSPEQLRPISVPLQEHELFVNQDHSGGLTREGSIFQRWLMFNHAVSSEPLSPGVIEQHSAVIMKDASDLGIAGVSYPELANQWGQMNQQREQRMTELFSPIGQARPVTVFEAAGVAGA